MVDISSVVLGSAFSLATIAVFVAMGFYAVKNLKGFKGGLLSNGWRFISIAVFFFIAGQLFLVTGSGQALQGLGLTAQYNVAFGSLMETFGGALLVLGFRAQNNVWKTKKLAPSIVAKANNTNAD
jgi:hypothetical protein